MSQMYGEKESEHIRLENEKLKLEIEELKRKGGLTDRIEKYIPVITALIAVLGFWFGVYQYFHQQQLETERQATEQKVRLQSYESELKRANDAKELELRKPFWEKQLALYFGASEAAATIATSNNPSEKRAAEAKFWNLYWGPLAIVEDAGMKKPEDAVIESEMVKFGWCLDGTEECDQTELKQRSLSLAHKFRESVGKSWDVKFADLTEVKTKK
ncbi:MAG TPA: hypothetical protein VF543_19165 [Pyrinomonadaceae bacterium]|jgi:hypothetical protein